LFARSWNSDLQDIPLETGYLRKPDTSGAYPLRTSQPSPRFAAWRMYAQGPWFEAVWNACEPVQVSYVPTLGTIVAITPWQGE